MSALQCARPQWSLTYTQGWWRQSYCAKVLGATSTGSCNGNNPSSACSLTLPSFNDLPANLRTIISTTCGSLLTPGGTTQARICRCFARLSGGNGRNALGHVMNSLLSLLTEVRTPNSDNVCHGAAYTPVADLYVCTKAGNSKACLCPTSKVGSWTNTVSNDCRTFVNEGLDEGKCLPMVRDNCQLQSCPCS